MKIINLTNKEFVFYRDDVLISILPPSATPITTTRQEYYVTTINNIPIWNSSIQLRDTLPPQREGIFYVVDPIMAMLVLDRPDFLVPSDEVLDKYGHVLGYKNLVNLRGQIKW